MLLGALLDICPASNFDNVQILPLVRSSIDCLGGKTADGNSANAIESILRRLSVDYVMCSSVPVHDGADGDIISVLENGGIELCPVDRKAYVSIEGAKLLTSVVSECGTKPDMDIIAIGYGADENSQDAFVCITLGETGQDSFLQKQYEYGEYV